MLNLVGYAGFPKVWLNGREFTVYGNVSDYSTPAMFWHHGAGEWVGTTIYADAINGKPNYEQQEFSGCSQKWKQEENGDWRLYVQVPEFTTLYSGPDQAPVQLGGNVIVAQAAFV